MLPNAPARRPAPTCPRTSGCRSAPVGCAGRAGAHDGPAATPPTLRPDRSYLPRDDDRAAAGHGEAHPGVELSRPVVTVGLQPDPVGARRLSGLHGMRHDVARIAM